MAKSATIEVPTIKVGPDTFRCDELARVEPGLPVAGVNRITFRNGDQRHYVDKEIKHQLTAMRNWLDSKAQRTLPMLTRAAGAGSGTAD